MKTLGHTLRINSLVDPKMRFVYSKHTGFTLIELLVTVVVVAILIGLAVPNMRDFIARNRVATQINDLLVDINFARTEAIKRATTVTLCISSNQTVCTPLSAWKDGWIVRLDTAPFEVLRATKAVASGVTLTTATFGTNIQYLPSGAIAGLKRSIFWGVLAR